jgi:hypothetical protein
MVTDTLVLLNFEIKEFLEFTILFIKGLEVISVELLSIFPEQYG